MFEYSNARSASYITPIESNLRLHLKQKVLQIKYSHFKSTLWPRIKENLEVIFQKQNFTVAQSL